MFPKTFVDYGFEVTQLSEYHFRISCIWSSAAVDFWPSSQRYLRVNAGKGVKSQFYSNEQELCEISNKIFKSRIEKQKIRASKEEQMKAKEKVDEFRKNPLAYIHAHT